MIISAVSILLSVAVLVGTTLAWFTDSVSNTGNVITAGNLQIDAYTYDLDMNNTSGKQYQVDGINQNRPFTFEQEGQNLKDPNAGAIISEELWEPGISNAKLLKVENTGNLATNIRLQFDVTDAGLMDALWFDFVQVDPVQGQFTQRPMSELNTLAQSTVVTLNKGESASFILVYGMNEDADNRYQGTSFSANVTIMATQATVEKDGFGNSNYDAQANGLPDQEWPAGGTVTITKPAGGWTDTVAAVVNASAHIPAGAIDESASSIVFSIVRQQNVDENVPVGNDQGAITYEITVTGLVQGNQEPITVELFVAKGLTGDVLLYHGSELVDNAQYDPQTGFITFTATSFSPFTVVFDSAVVTSFSQLKTAMETGGTITLGADIEVTETLKVESGKNVVLNLAGYDLKGVNPGSLLENYGTMTINGPVDSCVYTTDMEAQGRHAVVNYGTMTINGGTYGDSNTDQTDENRVQRGNAVRNLGTMTIRDGAFTAVDNGLNLGFAYAIANGDTSDKYPNASLTIENATVYGIMNGCIAGDDGKMVVNGGDYTLGRGTKGTSFRMVYTSGPAVVEVNGGTFVRNVDNNYAFFGVFYAYEEGHEGIIINGGVFEDKIHDTIKVDGMKNDGTYYTGYTVINGGEFLDELSGDYYKDNRYTYVSTLAELQNAIGEAEDGEVIKLTQNLTVSSDAEKIKWDYGVANYDDSSTKNVVIDLNGHTIYNTYNAPSYSNAFQWGGNSTLTLKNGTFDAGVGAGSVLLKSNASLVMEDVTVNSKVSNRAALKLGSSGTAELRRVTVNASEGACLEASDGTVNLYDCNFKQTGVSQGSDWYHSCITTSGQNPFSGWYDKGTVNVYGGTYTSEGYGVYILSSGGIVNLYDGTYTGQKAALKTSIDKKAYPDAVAEINLYGGTYSGALSQAEGTSINDLR